MQNSHIPPCSIQGTHASCIALVQGRQSLLARWLGSGGWHNAGSFRDLPLDV